MRWALKRQICYIVILAVVFLVFGSLIAYPYFNKAPTCSDAQMNGQERGIDCGGACARACTAEVAPLSVLWSRAFKVTEGRYNAVAYIENPNRNIAAQKVSYRFRFADANNVYIGKRDGSTYVPPSGHFAVFEPAIDVGHSTPVYVTFEFTSAPPWTRVSQEVLSQLKVTSSNIVLVGEDTSPRLRATVRNNSLFYIPEVDVVTILYDATGNAVSASRTYLDELAPEESVDVGFTWPEAFERKIIEKEILPMYDIFSVKLK